MWRVVPAVLRANCLLLDKNILLNKVRLAIINKRKFSEWQIFGSICLERKPVITQPLTHLEQQYYKLVQDMEVEKSYLSMHEKRHKNDLMIAEKLRKGEDVAISKETAQDFEDACVEELNKFQFTPRQTEADLKDDRKSLDRKLDSSLLLLVEQMIGNSFKWVLPQTSHESGETLRNTAERVVLELCGNIANIKFLGNAPVGHYKYKYPKAIRGNGIVGAKVFFFKAQLANFKDAVHIEYSDTFKDHLWLTHKEIEEILQPSYFKTINSFLYPDSVSPSNLSSMNNLTEDDDKNNCSSALSRTCT